MARIRTIKPEFWTHEDLSALPEATHMLAAALLNHADDEGYFNANPGLVKAACSPLREPSVSIQDSLKSLCEIGFITALTSPDGKRFGLVNNFDLHQRVNRPTPSKIKALGVIPDSSPQTHTQLTEDASPERNREQGTGKGREQESSLRSESSTPLALTPAPPNPKTNLAARVRQISDEAAAAYNAVLAKPHGELPACAVMNKPRIKAVEKCLPTARAMCRTLYGNERITPEFWRAYFEEVEKDDWHSGRAKGGPGHENWSPDFEYLLRENVMAKLFDRAMTEAAA